MHLAYANTSVVHVSRPHATSESWPIAGRSKPATSSAATPSDSKSTKPLSLLHFQGQPGLGRL